MILFFVLFCGALLVKCMRMNRWILKIEQSRRQRVDAGSGTRIESMERLIRKP